MDPRRRSILLALVATFSVLVSGCAAGSSASSKGKFRDADQRVALVADGGYRESFDLVVPRGAPSLTVRAALQADEGMAFALRNHAGRLLNRFTFPAQASVPEMTWIEVRDPPAGTWRLDVACGRRCDFAFGFYLRDAVPEPADATPSYADATLRFSEDTDAASIRINEFRMPANSSSLSLRVTASASEGIELRLVDPRGQARPGLAFPGPTLVDDAKYVVMARPLAGTWVLRAECDAGCAYAVGAYVD